MSQFNPNFTPGNVCEWFGLMTTSIFGAAVSERVFVYLYKHTLFFYSNSFIDTVPRCVIPCKDLIGLDSRASGLVLSASSGLRMELLWEEDGSQLDKLQEKRDAWLTALQMYLPSPST